MLTHDISLASLVQNEPSRFIDEIPNEFLDRGFAGGGIRNQTAHLTIGQRNLHSTE
jgi:DNA helicase-2/ATP-dependent DNA helicase PcrA